MKVAMNRETYTKVFLNSAKITADQANVQKYSFQWWYDGQINPTGGLRLSKAGRDFLADDLGITFYKIEFPPTLNVNKANVLLYINEFITCPYYLTNNFMELTDDRKAVELIMFSGDLERYGLIKAIENQKK